MHVSRLYGQVDEDVRAKKLNDALDRIRKVYEFDIKNVYAASIWRTHSHHDDGEEREVVVRESKQQALNKWIRSQAPPKRIYKQQETWDTETKAGRKTEQVLEDRARQSVRKWSSRGGK